MKRVTGIGGVFFKSEDPAKLGEWYREHLGIPLQDQGFGLFEWRDKEAPDTVGATVWSPFSKDTKYFDPSDKPFMINYRVDDLDAVLAALREEGVEVDEKIEEMEGIGRFGWCMDPEGNRIELWEPAKEG